MATPEPTISSAASRLCAACGMCCNGVMFHTVRMQPGDSPKALVALGLKLKRKQKHDYLLQPCPAFQKQQCSIYLQRPQRCRLFNCQQVLRVEAGETPEASAMAKIEEVQQRVAQVNQLLDRCGKNDPRRPLSKRYEKIMAEPVVVVLDVPLRGQLVLAMQDLESLLDADFRLEPLGRPH